MFLIHLHRVTHYVHVRSSAANSRQFMLSTDFDITTAVGDLSQLEVILADDTVKGVFELQVSGNAAASRGICITILDRRLLKEPAPVPRKEPDGVDEPDGDDDDESLDLGSDANNDDRAVVDTDEESGGTDE